MAVAFVLLRSIGKAVVKNVVNLFTFGVGGDILVDAWDCWQDASKEEQRPADVQVIAQMSAAELRAEVARIVREEAAALPPAQQAQVATYLGQVPAMIRRSLRRRSDPTGKTTVAGTAFRKPEDLAPLLPAGLPRFKAGDRPLPGVDWELVELLGVGGFGEVWKARNPHFDGVAPVALKFCLDPAAKELLLKHEAKIINQVMQQGKHEGIVPLLHTYLGANPPCLAYEYIDGGDLAGLIQERKGRGLAAPQAAQVIQRLAEIVGFAHRLSPPVVHRDLKPANVLVNPRPGGKLGLRITDFGIGGLAIQQAVAQSRRASKYGEFLTAAVRGSYTPLYGSPQQMHSEDPDPRDDVYALGVIWHQLLSGDLTTGRPGGEAWKKRLAERGMTPALLALLASSFEDRREDRPDNAVDLGEKLGRALAQPAPASDPSPFPQAIPQLDTLPEEEPRSAPPPRWERPRAPKAERARRNEVPKREPQLDGNGRQLLGACLALGGVLVLASLILGGFYWMIRHHAPQASVGGLSPAQPTNPDQLPLNPIQRPRPPEDVPSPPIKPIEPLLKNDITNSIGMKLKQIPAGMFLMGSPEGEAGRFGDEGPQHLVEITQPFLMGVYPVTMGQFTAFVKDAGYQTENVKAGYGSMWKNPAFIQTDNDPAVDVSRNDAVKFCEWLSKKEGKTYELPTEAQWEYACRAGTMTAFSFGDNSSLLGDYAKQANPWGLYDMHGNVGQWCADGKREYPEAPPWRIFKDPKGPDNGNQVIRGGRSAYRHVHAPGYRIYGIGFRVVCLAPAS